MSAQVTIAPHKGVSPRIDPSVFLADGCRIIGDVQIEAHSSVWFNTVIRGDIHFIVIGGRTNIQDLSMLHVTHGTHPLVIGNEVTIGHSVTVHGCTIQNRCLIGIGAVVLDGAVVEEESMVAAGAVVTPGFVVPHHTLVGGVPARVLRKLDADEIADLAASAERYVSYAREMTP
ncbi:gamma carbonic anhydrase family protein [Salinispira pacifica]